MRRVLDAVVRPCAARPALLVGLLVGHRARRRRHGPSGLRSPTHAVRREAGGPRSTRPGWSILRPGATGTGWELTPWHAVQRAAAWWT